MFIYMLVTIHWFINDPTINPNITNISAYKSLEKCEMALDEAYRYLISVQKIVNAVEESEVFSIKFELDKYNKRKIATKSTKTNIGRVYKCVKSENLLD